VLLNLLLNLFDICRHQGPGQVSHRQVCLVISLLTAAVIPQIEYAVLRSGGRIRAKALGDQLQRSQLLRVVDHLQVAHLHAKEKLVALGREAEGGRSESCPVQSPLSNARTGSRGGWMAAPTIPNSQGLSAQGGSWLAGLGKQKSRASVTRRIRSAPAPGRDHGSHLFTCYRRR
jgi:hypothetical protein